jgi:hypothetical protein
MANRSSGSYFKDHGFNSLQIKDGRIVRLRKDGRIKADLGPYRPGKNKVKVVANG